MTHPATAPSRSAPHPLRLWLWSRPEWWALSLAVAGWAALAAGALVAGPSLHNGHGPGRHGIHATETLWPTAVMVSAMMLPLVVPNIRFVAHASLWRRRNAAVAWFLAGYLGLWVVAQAGLEVALAWTSGPVGPTVAAWASVGAAAAWETSTGQRRRRRRCHRLSSLPPRGWAANAACGRLGLSMGVRCFSVCWAVMLVCAAFAHDLLVMAVVFGVQLGGRYGAGRSPRLGAGGWRTPFSR